MIVRATLEVCSADFGFFAAGPLAELEEEEEELQLLEYEPVKLEEAELLYEGGEPAARTSNAEFAAPGEATTRIGNGPAIDHL